MDKLKVIGGYLAKYHFWLLSVVAIIASLVGWMMARGTLSANYEKGKSEIVGKFSSLQSIVTTESPPNDQWKEKMSALTDEQREKVGEAWDTVYAEQKKVLNWPDVMGDAFKKWIDENPDADIPTQWLDNYQNHAISQEFPKLLKIVDAVAHDAEKPADGAAAVQPKVVWDTESQQAVQKSLAMPTRPDSFRVRLAQEDLWVYQALLSIIAKTNEGSQYTSRVKRIERLTIGEKAASDFAAGMAGGHVDVAQDVPREGPPAEPAAPPAAEGEEVARALDENRYVDADGKPQPGGTAKTQQFKRLPVSMQLRIDQREINRFLTFCANSPLPVEVRQLRVNPEEKGKGSSRPVAAAPQAGKPSESATQGDPFDVTLDIQGIIYLYNPPDDEKLGIPPDDGTGAPRKGRRRGRRGGGGGATTEQASATP